MCNQNQQQQISHQCGHRVISEVLFISHLAPATAPAAVLLLKGGFTAHQRAEDMLLVFFSGRDGFIAGAGGNCVHPELRQDNLKLIGVTIQEDSLQSRHCPPLQDILTVTCFTHNPQKVPKSHSLMSFKTGPHDCTT